jgi:hypothetical protein
VGQCVRNRVGVEVEGAILEYNSLVIVCDKVVIVEGGNKVSGDEWEGRRERVRKN